MSRLVIAILILFAVLVGLKAANSSLFQRNFANQLNTAAPATRSTGFSVDSTASSNNGGSNGVNSGVNNGGSTAEFNATNPANSGTTSLPPSAQQAVPGGW